MKAFAHLALLALLSVTSVSSNNMTPTTTATVTASTSTLTSTTTATVTAPTSTAPTTTATVTAPTSMPTSPTTVTVTAPTSTPTSTTTTTVTASTSTPTSTTTATVTAPTSTAPTTTVTVTAPTSTPTSPTTVTVTAPTSTPTSPTTATITKVTPGPSSNVTSATTSNPNPDTTGPCRENSCVSGSSCVNLNTIHFCLCIDGYYYKSSRCNKGMVFPGTIQVKMSETSGLENEMSKAYENLHTNITNFFQDVFRNLDYGQTVIYKVRSPSTERSEMRAGDKLVGVEVVNLFAENSKVDEMAISEAINKGISSNTTDFANYTKQDRCEFYGCVKNEQDDCNDGFLCKCKQGLERPNPQTAVCVALGPKCSDTCKAEHNMQCVVKSDGNSDCVCRPGFQKDDRGICQACAFGYSGVDCKDDFQLILTIVGTIAGILILGMVIALICMRSKTSKSIEEQNLIENDFQNLRLQHTTGFSNLGAEGSIFPKVRASFPSSQPSNPYAQSMPRPDY